MDEINRQSSKIDSFEWTAYLLSWLNENYSPGQNTNQ